MKEECKTPEEAERLRQWYRTINAKLGFMGTKVNEDLYEEEKIIRNLMYNKRKETNSTLPPAGPADGG